MSPELQEFLTAADLDDALRARERIAILSAQDEVVVRSALQRWQDPQAVSNLLVHASLIPQDLLVASLFRGLAERRIVFHVLAAVVGLQSIDPASLTDADRQRIRDALFQLIRDGSGIFAQRASVSIQRYLREEDAPQVFALWPHPDETVWHSLKAWLYRTFQSHGVESFAAATRQSGLAQDVPQRLVEDFMGWVAEPPKGFDNTLFLLYGNIPNLRDIERMA
jgi:hypothetical protein